MKVSWSGCPYGFDHLADESDCHVFYHCFDSAWGTVMIPKTCGPFLMFNPGKKSVSSFQFPRSDIFYCRSRYDSSFLPFYIKIVLYKVWDLVVDVNVDCYIGKRPLCSSAIQL